LGWINVSVPREFIRDGAGEVWLFAANMYCFQ